MKEVIIGFLAGVLSSMGFGGGSILLIYLTLFAHLSQRQAAGINLVYFLPCAFAAAALYLKNGMIEIKKALLLSLPAAGGALGGALLATCLDQTLIRRIFAVVLLVVGVLGLTTRKGKIGSHQDNSAE